MRASDIIAPLYPVGLVLANLGAGVGLYETGALGFSLVPCLCGVLVSLGIAASVGHNPSDLVMKPTEEQQ